MKRVLIGGCSFSEYSGFPDEKHSPQWISWTDLFLRDFGNTFNVINRAKASYGQSKIVESLVHELIQYNFEVDYVIVQWSAVGRSYSLNETDFFEKITSRNEISFSPYMHEYMINNDKEGWVTDMVNTIETSFYIASLTQILLLKNLLDYKKIKYKMLWGWGQITPEIEKSVYWLLQSIYDDNFWRYGKNHGGMSEIIMDNIGKTEGFISEWNIHPSTKGQEFFYNAIIKNIIKEI